jgi:D-alanyl-lipoteichoic acid acyltransferase DltB (MBOAT superfamily)
MMSATQSRLVLISSLAVILALFIYLKQYSIVSFAGSLDFSYSVVGLSYILFRVVHLLVDTYEGALSLTPRYTLSVTTYLFSFLTFLAGPIQRFEDFREQEHGLAAHRLTKDVVFSNLSRVATGYLKIIIIAEAFRSLHLQIAEGSLPFPGIYIVGAFAFLVYVYVNFSGYMDVMIGIGGLFGFSLPENFHYPLASANFIEIWSRWHITLSNSFRAYLYNPLLKGLATRWGQERLMPYWGVLAYFIVFFVMGLWHGSGSMFVVLGILLATGVSVNKLYEVEMKQRLGSAHFKRLRANNLYRALSRSAALTYLAICFTPIWPANSTMSDLWQLVANLGTYGLLTNVIASMVVLVVMQMLGARLVMLAKRFAWSVEPVVKSRFTQEAWLSLKVFTVGLALARLPSGEGPAIMYMSF